MEPMMDPPLQGEGKWARSRGSVRPQESGRPDPFVFSFIRSDRSASTRRCSSPLGPRAIPAARHARHRRADQRHRRDGPGPRAAIPRCCAASSPASMAGFKPARRVRDDAERVIYLRRSPTARPSQSSRMAHRIRTWPEEGEVPSNVVSFAKTDGAGRERRLEPWKRHWWGGLPPAGRREPHGAKRPVHDEGGLRRLLLRCELDPDVLGLACSARAALTAFTWT